MRDKGSRHKIKGKHIEQANSLVGAILKADYVILCTPTRKTPEIIRLIEKEMKRGTYLIEISSEKTKAVSSLTKMPAKINPIPSIVKVTEMVLLLWVRWIPMHRFTINR